MVAANTLVYERQDRINEYLMQNPGATMDDASQNYDSSYIYRRYLGHAPKEGSSVLQLGGSDPAHLSIAVQSLQEIPHLNYTAVNLNCGCPSPKVAGKGCFGAALMNEPDRVASIVTAMAQATSLPITVKCRIGVENFDYDNTLRRFIETVAATGSVRHFDVHARIAMLGLSPHGNRNIPPLKYDVVYQLVSDFPDLKFSLNGGLNSLSDVQSVMSECPNLQGCMIGRAWAADPWRFSTADTLLYGKPTNAARHRWQVLEAFAEHADAEEAKAKTVKELGHLRRRLMKALSPLFAGEPRSKQFRIALDAAAQMFSTSKDGANQSPGSFTPVSTFILDAAERYLSEEVLYRSPHDSYEKFVADSERKLEKRKVRDDVVNDWQVSRKKHQANIAH